MKLKKYAFKTPLFGSIECEELFSDTDGRMELSPMMMARMYDCNGKELMMFLTENVTDLAPYAPVELAGVVIRAEFGDFALQDGKMWLETYIYTEDHLTEEGIAAVQEWISGQMSDGWGEGLEQRAWMTDRVRKPVVYFETSTMEFDTYEELCEASYYVNPWSSTDEFCVYLDYCEEVEEEEPKLEAQEALKQIQEMMAQIVGIIDRIK